MIYNVSTKIAHLLENEQAVQAFDRFLPGLRKVAEGNPRPRHCQSSSLCAIPATPKQTK